MQKLSRKEDGDSYASGEEGRPNIDFVFIAEQAQKRRIFLAVLIMIDYYQKIIPNETKAQDYEKLLCELCFENCSVAIDFLKNAIKLGCKDLQYSSFEQCKELENTLIKFIDLRIQGRHYEVAKMLYFKEDDSLRCCKFLKKEIEEKHPFAAKAAYFLALIKFSSKYKHFKFCGFIDSDYESSTFNEGLEWLMRSATLKYEPAILMLAALCTGYKQRHNSEPLKLELNLDEYYLGECSFNFSIYKLKPENQVVLDFIESKNSNENPEESYESGEGMRFF